jgi:predicted nucleotidyltransferase
LAPGSADARPDSDVDILVAFHRVPGLLRFIELENHLSDLLGMLVDLVMEDALKPQIKERVLQEALRV